MKQRIMALLAALALVLILLAGCGGQEDAVQPPDPDPVLASDEAGEQTDLLISDPAPDPEEIQAPEDIVPAANEQPDGEDEPQMSDDNAIEIQPEEPAPDPEGLPAESEPAESVSTEPEPAKSEPVEEPAPEPEPESTETVPEDGIYTANVTLEGGSGRAAVESPATLRCEGGKFYATLAWSSPNFDYMKVDGEKYLPTNTEGNSTFEIPVAAFDRKLAVIADTVAMSEPHEVEYTVYFDSASLQQQ